MNGFVRLLLILSISFSFVSCATSPDEEDFSGTEEATVSDTASADEEFEPASSDVGAEPSETSSSEASLEDELDMAEGDSSVAATEKSAPADAPSGESTDEFADFETKLTPDDPAEQTVGDPTEPEKMETADQTIAESVPPPEIETPIESVPAEEMPPPMVDTAESIEPPPETEENAPIAKITNIKYKANDNGGTLVIEANEPLTFETRKNEDTNQFVIEIPNSELPAKLKRPYNTKDMKGGIGSVDAYQNKGSTTARIVVQLRPGAAEPTIQPEGNSLLVVQSGGSESPSPEISLMEGSSSDSQEGGEEQQQSEILSSASLQEFMSGNTQFYGKKISLEVSEMEVKEVFKLISEESGINMVLSDDVKGSVTLKLRQVPWDQALVVIMKARKLGYTRAGNVLRIAPLADIKAEEDDSLKLEAARKAQVALKVRMLPVSYAKIDDLINQIKPFLSERGKAVGDTRTSAIVVSDLDENLTRIAKLVSSIDIPPPQVLIEGKVVEASDQFQRQLGINWSASGQPGKLGNASNMRPIRGQTSVSVSPGSGASTGSLTFALGTLDVLGDLTATLALFEQQSAVKVLSSPRIVTLHNEPAEITQTTDIPLLKETIANGTTTRSVDFKSVKLKLGVTPQITNDASVIMTVDVNRDFLGGVEEQTTQSRAINTRTAKTKVMVRNGQTAVIGGIYQSDQNTSEARVPWVADIPVLGWLFKNRNSTNQKNELLIFLTPRILGQADSQSIQPRGTGGDLE